MSLARSELVLCIDGLDIYGEAPCGNTGRRAIRSEERALAGEISVFRTVDPVVFLVGLNLVGVRDFVALLHLVPEGDLVSLRPNLDRVPAAVLSEV